MLIQPCSNELFGLPWGQAQAQSKGQKRRAGNGLAKRFFLEMLEAVHLRKAQANDDVAPPSSKQG